MSLITDALDAVGIAYAEDSWAPVKPPQADAYAVVLDDVEVIGDDRGKTLCLMHSVTVEVYDSGFDKGKAARRKFSDALRRRGVKYEKHPSTYIASEKVYLTVFECEDYFEKESEV